MSARSAQPGNPREPGFSGGRSRLQGQSGEPEHSVFYLIFGNDYQRAWFCTDVGRCRSNDLASSRNGSSHGACRDAPRKMRRLLMHGKHKAWKREFRFDRIETAA